MQRENGKEQQVKDTECLAEIPVREDKGGDEGPEVEAEAQPARAHLHPHSWHGALHGPGVGVWLVPVGQRHHDVERGQAEVEVEKGVAVGDFFLLVVDSPVHAVLPLDSVSAEPSALLCLHQLVHLSVAG